MTIRYIRRVRRLRWVLVLQLVIGCGVVGATCVAVTGQRGPTGPWVGEVVNGTRYPIDRAAVNAEVFDADGGPSALLIVPTCPDYLMPGERGTFEVFGPPALSARPPLRIALKPEIGGFTGPGTPLLYRPDGLSVRLLGRDAIRKRVVAEVSNVSNLTYAYVHVCANVRAGSGQLLEVATVDPFGMPIIELAPGERRAFSMAFDDLPQGDIEFVARGSESHRSGTPRVTLKDLTVLQRREVVDDSGQLVLRLVGEIDVSAFRDIGGLRLSAHVDGDYEARVDGAEAGCGGLADSTAPAPVAFAIPIDGPAVLRDVVVETILGTPDQNLRRLTAETVTHRAATGDTHLVNARIMNSFDTPARLLGVCLLLRGLHGELVGAASFRAVQFLAPGESVQISGEIVALGTVGSAEAIAFGHVLPAQ